MLHSFLHHPGPLAFAHRGGAGDAPENTMHAFQAAVQIGFRYVETDVQVTADDVVVAFHDDDLERTCDRPGRIHELPWREVAQARVAGREPIPRLDDMLAAWPNLRWNLDCKSDRAVQPLSQVLQRSSSLDRVCVGSFSDRRLRTLRRSLGPQLCTSAGPVGVARIMLASRLWSAVARPASQVLQVPVRHGAISIINRDFIEMAHRHDLHVHVWTVDEPSEMHRLLDLGVDGLMTDRPAVLRAVLEERGQWC